ncbi:MAG: CHAD domain-containing protein [Bacteroidales bacterium]|nr:CHAD domain-containing protein [Bacteroidales bacterium]
MQSLLIRYSDNSFNALENSLKSLGEDCSVELVHSLRLNIKKIRALITAIDYKGDSLNDILIFKRIDSFFIRLGYLRDGHVQMILLEFYRKRVGEEVDGIVDYINRGKKKINKSIEKKIRKINIFDIILLNQRFDETIESLDNEKIEEKVQQKVDLLFNQIVQLTSDDLGEEVLHRIRKLIKELIYIFSTIKKAKMNTKYNSSFTLFLNTLQQKLGRWHDLSVLVELINEIDSCSGRSKNLLQVVEYDKRVIQMEIAGDLRKLRDFNSM